MAFFVRVGGFELGPSFGIARVRSEWTQRSYRMEVRYPFHDVTGPRRAIIPHISAGALLVDLSYHDPVANRRSRDRGVWPVAEVGVVIEVRQRRWSVGLDAAAGLHRRQTLEDAQIEVSPHVEGTLLVRAGLLFY